MESRGVTPEGERILGYMGVMPIVEKFTDISGHKREILRVNGEYMVYDTYLTKKYFSTVELKTLTTNQQYKI